MTQWLVVKHGFRVVALEDTEQDSSVDEETERWMNWLRSQSEIAGREVRVECLDRFSWRDSTRKVIAATTQQAATRYLIIANALMERGQFDAALAEIDRGLVRDAGEASLRLARVKVLIKLKQFDAAIAAAGQLGGAAPGWQAGELRGEALIALGRWPEAKLAVADAVKLNPHPGHAFYLSGLIAAQEQDWKAAAEAFRKAYEAKSSAKAPQ
jgi:tetratricopeptide (TPR) repeat protein